MGECFLTNVSSLPYLKGLEGVVKKTPYFKLKEDEVNGLKIKYIELDEKKFLEFLKRDFVDVIRNSTRHLSELRLLFYYLLFWVIVKSKNKEPEYIKKLLKNALKSYESAMYYQKLVEKIKSSKRLESVAGLLIVYLHKIVEIKESNVPKFFREYIEALK